MPTPRLKIVLAKPGLDGHTRGIQYLARSLRDAGAEVVYLGLYQTAKQIAAAAVDENADAIGLSILSGASPVREVRELRRLLQDAGADDIAIVVGGIIQPHEADELQGLGVAGVFGPGSSIDDIMATISASVA